MITRMDNKPSSTWLFPIPTTCTPTPMEGGRGDSIIVGSATDADGGPHSVPPNLSNHASNFHNLGPPPLCAGCNLRIVDKFYLSAVDSKWHVNCLKCSECGMELESQVSCYERDGLILCKEDYLRQVLKNASGLKIGYLVQHYKKGPLDLAVTIINIKWRSVATSRNCNFFEILERFVMLLYARWTCFVQRGLCW